MKQFSIYAFFFITFISFAQSRDSAYNIDIKVLYRLDYTKYVGSEKKVSENQVLIVKNGGNSCFTFENMVALDSIQKIRTLNLADVMSYKSPLYYLIKRKDNIISHFELVGNDLIKYDENIAFEWKLVDDSKMINGYNCKKATIIFEGREWIAWYAVEIPVNVGPYKFYDLPGLILELSDTHNLFRFSILSLETGYFEINDDTSNYFISDGNNTIQTVEKYDFHSIRKKFHQMSMAESIKYMNRGEAGVYGAEIISLDGENVNTNRKPKTKNFIEKYD